jgi:predicted ATPase/DNA-binding SARP family transcriptional activator
MPALTLALLGPPHVTRADGGAVAFRSRKHLALLAYLAVEQRHSHSRDTLLGLLWPEAPEDAARSNLRVALADLRRLLGESDAPFLLASRHSVQFAPASDHTLDVAVFSTLLAECRAHAHDAPASCEACMARLAQAVELYRGDFLAGFALPDSAAFEEWALIRREQLHQQALEALDTLAAACERQGNAAALCRFARRQLALEPWREQAHRQLMRGLALSGDRRAALAQYETCRRILAAELGVEPEAATSALYDQIRAGEARRQGDKETRSTAITSHSSLSPGLPVSLSVRHNLPSPLTSFIGRADELAHLAALLNGDTRLLTVVGAGGVGKTRLALAAAGALRGQFADGTWWVALAGVQPADEEAIQRATLASVIATALGRTLGGRRPPLDELADVLHDCAALIVLDNCEHLPEVAAAARTLLETAPKLRVLATSREPLGLSGEALLRLGGLSVPEAGAADPTSYPGVRLFLERVARHTPGWGQDAAQIAAVARLCRLLDGLPLGIELAAHWVGHYTPDEIAAAIQTDLDFLAARTRDLPDRHRSLRAVFGYTWSLLTAVEQQGLARLSVFRGSFDRAAAQAVAGVRATTLVALVDKTLLRQAEVGRYNLHELLRQFTAERLDASGEAIAMRVQHAAYYLELAEATAPALAGAEQAAGLARLEREHDNLRAALAFCLEELKIENAESRKSASQAEDQFSILNSQFSISPLEIGLRLAGALWPFWQRHCHLAEGRRWLEGFLAAQDGGTVALEVRATALIGAAWLAHDQDDYARADALFEEGLRLEQALGRTGRAAAVLAHRGLMALWQGLYAEATALVEESLALARAAEDQVGVAYALFRLGLVTRERGDFARSAALYRECQAVYHALGDRSGAAFALLGLGDIARDQGDAAQVETCCAESLAIGRELGQHWCVGFSLNNLALAAAMRSDLERAAVLAEEGLALFRAHGIRGGVVELLITRGQIACAQGDFKQARATLAEGVALGWPAGPHWLVATGLEQLARVALAAGDAPKAARLCGAVATWRTEMGAPLPPYRRASYDATLAAVHRTLGEDDFATAWTEGTAWRLEQAIAAALTAAPAVPGPPSGS